MINIFRVGHLAYDLRNAEVMDAFKKDPEAEMDRYYLSEEDRAPIRAKNVQPFLDAGVNANMLRSLCVAIGIPPINPSTRTSGSQRLEELQRNLIAASGQPAGEGSKEQLTPEEAQKRAWIKKIEAELKLVDPLLRIRR